MHISDEGLVAGSVNRTELAAAYADATDDAVKENLAAVGAENGMYVEGGKLVDPSAPEEPAPEPEADLEAVIAADTEGAVSAVEALGGSSGEPPRGGPGSGRSEWADYANTQGVEVTEDMTRDDIITAIEASKE